MPIRFIPNDPIPSGKEGRQQAPHPARPQKLASFKLPSGVAEGVYPFGTEQFLHWQTREAALRALAAFEQVSGRPLRRWALNRKLLEIHPNLGVDLNAYYNRTSLSFFEDSSGGKKTYSGASTDVVAHETGHALLDALRPDLWNSFTLETNAFHEAFGDCVAILTALSDREQRLGLLKVTSDLWAENSVEAVLEDLAAGIRRRYGASSAGAAPRHAYNWFRWELPTTLPDSAPPKKLSRSVHSFSRVFTGCFWDLIAQLWNSTGSQGEAQLWKCAQTAGHLLVEGVRGASDVPRFFQSVGEAMSLADQANGGENLELIQEAFAGHGVVLAPESAVLPHSALLGATPRVTATGVRVDASTKRDILTQFSMTDAISVETRASAAGLAEVIARRPISLSGLSEGLEDVVVVASHPVRVGASGGHAAVVGSAPSPGVLNEEIRAYVGMLVQNDQIDFDGAGTGAAGAVEGGKTYFVRRDGNRAVLQRASFACRLSH